ncbi:MOSC domain-containing protein [Catenulispora subtropica]|uniref:MOSC domain-containing protein n=1 Tax=Catenulispora subtropica TaxID=450798 RepID=A0ABN2R731_9ACTN
MHVAELWRYPVKSLRGERLGSAVLTADGVAGDRVVHVRQRGDVATARTRHRLLGLDGTTGPDGAVRINGLPWDGPEAADLVRHAAGEGAEPVWYTGPERFDVLPLLVATDGGIEAFGYDGRRLRPNIVVGGVPGLAEREWPGAVLRIGEALIGVRTLRARCIVTTIDPDDGSQNLDVLRRIHRVFGTKLALNCWVGRPGTIRLGDPVELLSVGDLDEPLPEPSPGGWIVGAPYSVP